MHPEKNKKNISLGSSTMSTRVWIENNELHGGENFILLHICMIDYLIKSITSIIDSFDSRGKFGVHHIFVKPD